MASFAEYTKKQKKKKKQSAAGNTFTEYTMAVLGKNDIEAPLSERVETEDIAPVKKTTAKKTDDRKWFQKGAFEDGYQFGDLTKTIIGSGRDLGENLTAGILDMGEKVVDTLATVAPYVTNPYDYKPIQTDTDVKDRLQQLEQNKKVSAEFVKKDLYDAQEVARKIVLSNQFEDITGISAKTDSVFGDKSDSLVQSGGQLLGTVGLQAVGVPWFVTTGVTSFGGEVESAMQQGATNEEAMLSGVITAGAEILTEKLSGGIKFGGKTLDDVLLKPLTDKIASKATKTLVNIGIDAAGEGTEEIISQVFSNLGSSLYKEENLDELLLSEEAMDEYIESFIGGAVLGGGSSVIRAGIDSIPKNKLTENEQKVVDKVYEDRIAEAEESGKKLTQKEKDKIYDSVLNDMEKGFISTDTIESVLGGETYKTYKDTIDSEEALSNKGKALLEEFTTLNKMKQGEMTGEQVDRREELRQQLTEISALVDETMQNSQKNQLKEQLSNEVFGIVQSDRLAESYNEKSRRGMAFEADLSKYDKKYQATIKKAVESGILNNTNRTHEFVEIISKISADKGVLFDFTNNAKLKESGFAVDGKTVNGFVTKDGISINIDSAKAWQSTVGHEITHILEGTELYNTLQQTITEYAKSKGDYDGRLETLTKLYEGVEGANVEAELTADLVGDYLFTDSDFIRKLSTEHRNVFQKIYDEIKYLYKIATAGSKEARELEKVKRAFDEAYKESGKANVKADTKYSLTAEQETYFKDSKVRDESGNLKVMYHGTSQGGHTVFDTYGSNYGLFGQGSYFTDNKSIAESYTKKGKGNSPQVYESYLNITNPMDMDGQADVEAWTKQFPDAIFPESGTNEDFYRAMEDYLADEMYSKWEAAEIAIDGIQGMGFDGVTHIGGGRSKKSDGTKHRVYIAFEPEQIKNIDNVKPTDNPDIRYSLSDNEGKKLSKEQQEYFKDSKIVDKNGNLQVMYHGTAETFTVFDKKKAKSFGTYGNGFYFSDSNSHAGTYGETLSVYLNITNPLKNGTNDITKEQLRKFVEAIAEDEDYGIENYGYGATVESVTDSVYGKSDFGMLMDLNISCVGNMVEAIELFNKVNGTDYNGIVAPTETVAFYPEQIKRIDNTKPTYSPDIRYSLSEADNTYLSAVEKGDTETAQRMVDEAADNSGYTIRAYHGTPNTEFTVFDKERLGKGNDQYGAGFYFASDKTGASHYGNRVIDAALDIKNPIRITTTSDSGRNLIDADIELTSEQAYEVVKRHPDMYDEENSPLGDYFDSYWENGAEEWMIESLAEQYRDVGYLDSDLFRNYPNELHEALRDVVGYDGVEVTFESTGEKFYVAWFDNQMKSVEPVTYDNNGDVIPLSERFNKGNNDIRYSLSEQGEQPKKYGNFNVPAKNLRLETAPTQEVVAEKATSDSLPDDFAPITEDEANEMARENLESLVDEEAPPETEAEYYELPDTTRLDDKTLENISKSLTDVLSLNKTEAKAIQDVVQKYSTSEFPSQEELFNEIREQFGEKVWKERNEEVAEVINYKEAQARAEAEQTASEYLKDIAPVKELKQDRAYETIRPKPEKQPKLIRVDDADTEQHTAELLTEEPKVEKKKRGLWSFFKEYILDKGMVFESLSKKTKNRELEAKWNFIRYADGNAQRLIGKGGEGVKALKGIQAEVEKAGLTKQLYEYLYHKHNVDRMTLAERYEGIENKAVFGNSVTAEISQQAVEQIEKANPKLIDYANDIYKYNKHLRNMLVDGGVISQETADLWEEMYPHYVPIRRVGDTGLNINVPLDTGKTGVNAPIKRATGGSSDILPLFDTMAQRTLQTYKAIAKNKFGVELKNTLGTTIENAKTNLDEVIDSIDTQDGLLQEGKNGKSATFTVFENGEKVTFEITDEMYDALKPKSNLLSYRNKYLGGMSNIQRGLLTEYNPVFMLTNAVKDVQDVLINSQHAVKTYANFPKAIGEMLSRGKYYTEYMENGGEQNTYFDNESNTFAEERKGIKKLVGMPLDIISNANNIIERLPRLAEYIASRKSGRSIEVSMLDAARVTTNFAAGGDVTKFLNANGCTFLSASVNGAVQQARNFQEAKMNGFKGWVGLATKFALAGLPAMLLNSLLWDDDEDYEELSDYVKDSYYVVAKTSDGHFVRIPKGRALAVIQNAIEQIKNAATGEDEVDLANFLELAVSNLAPNNPLDSNIFAPIMQVANNETWYGEDLVPTRLQDLPAKEQFDESTDNISKWLGEKLNFSPYKANYLLNQYSGGVGDVFLPMLTPEAESGDNSLSGNLIAPLKDKFTTDSTMNNQNVSDFYNTVDELTTNAKSSEATEEDILKYKYMNSVNAELGELYGRKREVQNNSYLTDEEKYNQVRDIQEQINSLAEESLSSYENVNIQGNYATVGDLHYRWYEPSETSDAEAGWQKISGKQLEKQEKVTSGLGISASDYWGNKEEYDYAYEYPEKYAVAKSVGGYETYKSYSSELYDIKADKDENGKSISGSRKEKVLDYVNNLDIDYGEKIILFKNEYNADDTYNYEIIDYLNSREDISYEEMETILKELGFTVKSDGTIEW